MWNVLVVDDSLESRSLMAEMLSEIASCDLAKNGKDALESYYKRLNTEDQYDAIVLDIVMEDFSGLEVLQLIREFEQERGIKREHGTPIIAVTAYKDRVKEISDAGCDEYFLKPIESKTFINRMRSRLKVE